MSWTLLFFIIFFHETNPLIFKKIRLYIILIIHLIIELNEKKIKDRSFKEYLNYFLVFSFIKLLALLKIISLLLGSIRFSELHIIESLGFFLKNDSLSDIKLQ